MERAGVGVLGIVDPDIVNLSNIHRQSLYSIEDLKKSKIKSAQKKLKKINSKIKVNAYKIRLNIKNYQKIIKNYDYIIDGSDNFETKFLINDVSRKYKKFLVTGASFDFKNKKTPCIRSFYQEYEISDDALNCEYEGILGTVAGIIGIMQANEIIKKILSIGKNLNGQVLVIDLLNLNFRKIKFKKLKDVKKKI